MEEALASVYALEKFLQEVRLYLRQLAGHMQTPEGPRFGPSDVAQEATLKLFQAFQGGSVPCDSQEEFIPYLRRVLENTLTDLYRTHQRDKRDSRKTKHFGGEERGDLAGSLRDSGLETPSIIAVAKENHSQLRAALEKLDDPELALAARAMDKPLTYEMLGAVLAYEKYLASLPVEEQLRERDKTKKRGKRAHEKAVKKLRELMGETTDEPESA
jgi:RNA polymerase sigma factor (sigma-70 family)